MKKTIRTVALMMVLSMAAVSCQKETLVEPEATCMQVSTMRTIVYTIDGVGYQATLHNDAEWDAFITWMLALAREGREVTFYNPDAMDNTVCTKEVVTYTTSDPDDANAWAKQMADNGYQVKITYDNDHNVYVCIAVK